MKAQIETLKAQLITGITDATEKQAAYLADLIDNAVKNCGIKYLSDMVEVLETAIADTLTIGNAITIFKASPLEIADYDEEKAHIIKMRRWGK